MTAARIPGPREAIETRIARRLYAAFGVEMPRTGSFSAASGPDIVIAGQPDAPPIAIELFVRRQEQVPFGLLRDRGHRLRRQFPSGVHLVLIAVDDVRRADFKEDTDTSLLAHSFAKRLVVDGFPTFDQVLINLGRPNSGWRSAWPDVGDVPPSEDGIQRIVDLIVERARLQAATSEEPETASGPEDSSRIRVLLVADEWHSGLGGISTINRDLATALAQVGADVKVVVPEANDLDRKAAAAAGVELTQPATVPGLTGKELLRGRPEFADPTWEPHLIVGHGRILGPYAYAVQHSYFANARRLHIVHTHPERLEQAKSGLETPPDLAQAGERRKTETELARTADLVAGVGPLLKGYIANQARGWNGSERTAQIFELIPGLKDWGQLAEPGDAAESAQVLLIARAEDIQSKGIDIAIRATRDAARGAPEPIWPELIIRGVPNSETAAKLQRIVAELGWDGTHVALREFSVDDSELRADLMSCCMLLMPSRHEGFGLAALEAISAAVPVLISRESGLAQLLRREFPDGNRPWPREVVPTSDDEDESVAAWSRAILEVLLDPEGASKRAFALREEMARKFDWQTSARSVLALVRGLGPR